MVAVGHYLTTGPCSSMAASTSPCAAAAILACVSPFNDAPRFDNTGSPHMHPRSSINRIMIDPINIIKFAVTVKPRHHRFGSFIEFVHSTLWAESGWLQMMERKTKRKQPSLMPARLHVALVLPAASTGIRPLRRASEVQQAVLSHQLRLARRRPPQRYRFRRRPCFQQHQLARGREQADATA